VPTIFVLLLTAFQNMKLFCAFFVPVVTASDPFPASAGDGSWQWVDVEGTQCMGGEQTGVYVRYSQNGNKNLGVYLYGGGACFNALTCATAATTNPHPGDMGSKGIFEPRSDNPLNDYNWITVPYCTGDVHGGQNEETIGLKKRRFSGATNLKLIMERAVLTFTDVRTLFVTGESAGGFGSLAAYPGIRENFPNAHGVLMDDSGQVLGDEYLAPCLVEEWRQAWNLNANLPADCPCNNDEGNLDSAWAYGRQKYPGDSLSLISSINDVVISTFFGFGLDNCSAALPVGFNKMHEGLEALAATGVNIYMIPGAGHTHTSHDEFYSRVVDGVGLYQWVAQLIDPDQPDPATVRPTSEDVMQEAMVPPPAAQPFSGIMI
jgi:hypothetical protein